MPNLQRVFAMKFSTVDLRRAPPDTREARAVAAHPIDAWHRLVRSQDPGTLDSLLVEEVPSSSRPMPNSASTIAWPRCGRFWRVRLATFG